MSLELDQARSLLDTGDYKKAVDQLWVVEAQARSDPAIANGLLEVAARAHELSTGRTRTDAAMLVDYARSHIGRLTDPAPASPGVACRVLGGFGWELAAGGAYELDFDPDGVAIYEPPGRGRAVVNVPFGELLAFEIGGPGAFTTGGGFAGGGFGIEGALEGMLAAGVLNALTTRTKVVTTFSLHTRDAEAFFLHEELTPQDLRIRLSEVFVRMRQSASKRAVSE